MYNDSDKKQANKLKVNLYIDLLGHGKMISSENKEILRILCKDHEIKKEVHQYLRERRVERVRQGKNRPHTPTYKRTDRPHT